MQVTLLQSGQTILTTFTGNLQTRALETFRKTGVDVRLGVRVTEVTATKVCVPTSAQVTGMRTSFLGMSGCCPPAS